MGWLFDARARAEMRLHDAGLFRETDGPQQTQWSSFFFPWTGQELSQGYIGDDHVPFLRYGVNVWHVVPEPFPSVWLSSLDWAGIEGRSLAVGALS